MIRHDLRRGTIYKGRAEGVYELLEPGSVTLLHSDGPYGMGMAEWDRIDDLAAFYAPHLEAWGKVCAPSASVYFWNTAEGWAQVHPLFLAAGWRFVTQIVWVKPNGLAMRGVENMRSWPDVTEVCGFYMRDGIDAPSVAYAAGRDEGNWIRVWLLEEWESSGLPKRAADAALGTNGMAGHYFGSSQWALPTWDAFQKLAAYAAEHGTPRERPYFVHPDAQGLEGTYRMLQATFDQLLASYQHLRERYEALRAPFTLTAGLNNVWQENVVAGKDRLCTLEGETLHPCQKPLVFAERIVEASSRPGDLVFDPFGGTCRIATYLESVTRMHPEKARRHVTAEIDEDGKDYIGAVLRSLDSTRAPARGGQLGLFGARAAG